MTDFTPWTALAGGALIGLSAALLLWFNGRIAGVSGIAAGLLGGDGRGWRLLFLGGLVLGAVGTVGGAAAVPRPSPGAALLIGAGLLVGYGTSWSGGCTSGHGVCGLARLSLRSLVAVAVFLLTAIATVFVVRHALGAA